jgi:ankyrin repeat protein
LHEAANRGHFSVARELLRNGARVDATGMDGVTPLHDAAVNGHENIVALLLRFGANPSLKTSSSKTAQDLAGSPQVVRLLAQQQGCDEDENITDENIPVEKSVSAVTSSMELSWKKKWEYPKSRRSLKLGKWNYMYHLRKK